MNSVICSILSKKENLSYPLVFSKIAKYYWNIENLCKYLNCKSSKYLCISVIKNNYTRMLKFFTLYDLFFYSCRYGNIEIVKYTVRKGINKDFELFYDGFNFALSNNYNNITDYLLMNGGIKCLSLIRSFERQEQEEIELFW